MDCKVIYEKLIFDIFKTIIIEQNKLLLKEISVKFELDYEELLQKYIKPEYYLPVIEKPKAENLNI